MSFDLYTFLGAVAEANIALVALFALYRFVLKQLDHYSYARFFLLSSGIVAIAIASTNIEVAWGHMLVFDRGFTQLSELFPIAYSGPDHIGEIESSVGNVWDVLLSWPSILTLLFVAGIAISLLNFILRWAALDHRIHKSSQFVSERNIYINDRFDTAFAYLNKVYIPRACFSLSSEELDLIIEHEREHIRKAHHIDRLFLAIIRSLFWFNPFVYRLEKELFAVHEYQIDASLTYEMEDPSSYTSLLLKLQSRESLPTILTQFSMPLIKSRVHRLHQTKSSNMKKVIFLLILPVVGGLFYAFSVQLIPEQIYTHTRIDVAERTYGLPMSALEIRSYNPYGLRESPFASSSNERQHHNGIDLVAPKGTPIMAAASGVVEVVEYSDEGYGNHIAIRHDDSSLTRYAHLEEVTTTKGAFVEKGAQIATCGSTGKSTGPHLHFELWINGAAVDPEPHIDLSSIESADLPKIARNKMVVILDVGHGGHDPGQEVGGVREKDVAATIATRISNLLASEGIRVVMTREEDQFVSLADRVGNTDSKHAIFISLHANAAKNENARGLEMYIPGDDHKHHSQSMALANQFSVAFNESNVINRGTKSASFYVLKNSQCPSILIELGFLSNELDREALQSEPYQLLIAQQISNSIASYAR